MAGLKTIIALSFVRYLSLRWLISNNSNATRQVLAIGFLLVILSSALWKNYFPLLVVATYVVAPLPNWICNRCSNPDDFIDNAGSALVDFGRFFTGFLVLMGIGMLLCSFACRPCTVRCYERYTDMQKSFSAANTSGALWHHCISCYDHVHRRRPFDLRHHHQLHDVLSGRAGVLMALNVYLFV